MTDEQKLAELLGGPVKPKGLPTEPDPTEEIETLPKEDAVPTPRLVVTSSGVTTKNLFQHPDAHAVVLDLCLLRRYGAEWYAWEPETLETRIPQDFKIAAVSDLNMSKIQACRSLHMVDSFWKQWEIFLWCAMPFNGMFPDFETMQVPTVAQCAVAVDIGNQLRDDVEWSSEVTAYLKAVHEHDGVFVAQPPLDFVPVSAADTAVNPVEVSMLWPAVKASNKMPTADTVTAEQLRRMLVIHQTVQASKDAMRDQLPLVQDV